MPVTILVPSEVFPVIGAWGDSSALPIGGVMIASNGLLAALFLAATAVWFARPLRK